MPSQQTEADDAGQEDTRARLGAGALATTQDRRAAQGLQGRDMRDNLPTGHTTRRDTSQLAGSVRPAQVFCSAISRRIAALVRQHCCHEP